MALAGQRLAKIVSQGSIEFMQFKTRLTLDSVFDGKCVQLSRWLENNEMSSPRLTLPHISLPPRHASENGNISSPYGTGTTKRYHRPGNTTPTKTPSHSPSPVEAIISSLVTKPANIISKAHLGSVAPDGDLNFATDA
jgi:hypothetical protein